jgi:hypothetical protein
MERGYIMSKNFAFPISGKVYSCIKEIEEGRRSYVIFKVLGHEDADECILFCHGTKNGEMLINNQLLSPKQVLEMIYEKITAKGIKKIYTLSCYGGNQEKYSYKGISIESAHDSKEKICTKAYEMIDGGYELGINL